MEARRKSVNDGNAKAGPAIEIDNKTGIAYITTTVKKLIHDFYRAILFFQSDKI